MTYERIIRDRRNPLEGKKKLAELADTGLIRTRVGKGYIRLKYRHQHRYVGIVERMPLFPHWPYDEPYAITRRCLRTADGARDWGMGVYMRYVKLSQVYWKNYFSGTRGFFRKIWVKFRAKVLRKQ